jgi:hypothetical protein
MKRDRIKDALDRGYDDITARRVIQSFARVDLQRHVIWTRSSGYTLEGQLRCLISPLKLPRLTIAFGPNGLHQ